MQKPVKTIFCPALWSKETWTTIVVDPFVKSGDIVIIDPLRAIESPRRAFLYDAHKSYALNKAFEIPFQSHWLKKDKQFNEIGKTPETVELIVVFETSPFAFSKSALRYLKRTFFNAKLCYQGLNPLTDTRLLRVQDCYDEVITIVPEHAKQYGWVFHEVPYGAANPQPREEYKCDVFFVGQEKGRLPQLLDYYRELTALGKTCSFLITDVKESNREEHEGIVYLDHDISYREILDRVVSSECLLEVVAKSANFPTLRMMEALTYKKRLITTNKSVPNFSYYDPNTMHIVKRASDVTAIDWSTEVLYETPDCCRIDKYLEFLRKPLS